MTVTVAALAERFQAEVLGNRELVIHGAESIRKAGPHEIAFVANASHLNFLKSCNVGAVLIGRELRDAVMATQTASTIIVVDDSKAAFITILKEFRPNRTRTEFGISTDANVSDSAQIGTDTNIYPGVFIDNDVIIGERCDIWPGVSIAPGCRLGDEVTLYPNVVLYSDTQIGNRVIVHASAVLGADGFGYEFEEGRFVKVPQLGCVVIEDDAEIGAGSTIDRGMIGATIIGAGTKLDNQVMIAHNCELGRHNAFASQVGFAGSTTTGDYVRCGGQVGVANHVHLGDGCTIDAKSGIHRDVPAGETYFGYPATRADQQFRMMSATSKLPEMRKKLKQLESQIAELTARLDRQFPENRAA